MSVVSIQSAASSSDEGSVTKSASLVPREAVAARFSTFRKSSWRACVPAGSVAATIRSKRSSVNGPASENRPSACHIRSSAAAPRSSSAYSAFSSIRTSSSISWPSVSRSARTSRSVAALASSDTGPGPV